MSPGEKLKEVAAFLKSSCVEDSAKEAEILIAETLKIDRASLYSGDLNISDEASGYLDSLAARRAEGEPLQYITGYVEFCGLKISVGKGVLIPRPETELLVEKATEEVKRIKGPRLLVLDLCTGSGCIAIALAKYFPEARVYGTDRSAAAFEYALRNTAENGVANVHFREGDLFQPVDGMKFDLIVSNPPYVRRDEIKTLQREVRDYEPVEALDGGPDGLDYYRRIFEEAPGYLKGDGLIMLEIGYDQADDIEKIAKRAGFRDVEFIRDYAGIKRIFSGTYR